MGRSLSPPAANRTNSADPVIGTTQLLALLIEQIGRNADLAGKIGARAAEIGKRYQRSRAEWRKEAEERWTAMVETKRSGRTIRSYNFSRSGFFASSTDARG